MHVNEVNNNKVVSNMVKKTNTTNTAKKASFDTYLDEVTSDAKEVSMNDIFEKAAKTYNVPVNLLKAIGYTESNFRVNATSHCGAQGVMQLMPGTAKALGVTDAYDPEQNIMGGAKYISQLLKKYDGNTSLALAAYNAGSGNVAKYGGIPPFKETQNYVVKVTKYMNQELDADQRVVIGGSNYASTTPSEYTPVFEEVNEEDIISLKDQWDEIFSYDNYELFLKLLNQDKESEQEEGQQKDTTLSKINMNPSIAKLLTGSEISFT